MKTETFPKVNGRGYSDYIALVNLTLPEGSLSLYHVRTPKAYGDV